MKKTLTLSAAVFFLLSSINGMTIAEKGKACAAVILPEKAQPSVKVAAEELVYHVRKASGAELAVYPENKLPENLPSNRIYLGTCRRTAAAGIDSAKLPPAGHLIRVAGNEMFITGNDRDTGPVGSSWNAVWHGTLWGVYEFLEREMNVRWLWPGELGEVIPVRKTITVKDGELKGAPKLLFTDLTARRRKYNMKCWYTPEAEQRYWDAQSRFLLRHRIGSTVNMNYSHEFGQWWKMYGEKHPEYFALTNSGKRGPLPGTPSWGTTFVDMCLSNPGFHRQIIHDWEHRPAKMKQRRPYIGVGLNDMPIMCVCPACRAWDQKDPRFAKSSYWGKGKVITFKERWAVGKAVWGEEGTTQDEIPSLTDRYARYLLAIQKEAAKKHPGVPVIGFAYANYRKPPTEVKLNDGIIIMNTAALFFPYTEAVSKAFREEWTGWKNTGVRQHYRPNLLHAGANLPIFYARRFADDFRFAYRNGMTSSQIDSLFGAWSSQAPTLYTVLRMHSDPDRQGNEILKDFYSCFGPAAREVEAYFKIWEDRSNSVTEKEFDEWKKRNRTAAGPGGGFKNFIAVGADFMTPEVLAAAKKQLDKARKAAAADPRSAARVEFLAKGLHEAELTVECRRAQLRMAAEKTPESKKAFRHAWEKLEQYRRSIENDFVLDIGKVRFREQTGCGWPKK